MTLVVKVGGEAVTRPSPLLANVTDRVAAGDRIVLVHGGSTAVDETLEALGMQATYVTTPAGVTGRFTDAATMRAVTMALAGLVNVDLTTALQHQGTDVIGLTGVDGALATGPRKSAVRVVEDGKRKIKRGDHAGRIESIDDDLLSLLLDAGYTPVVSLPMLAADGTAVNTDADRLAAAIAASLGGHLVLLTDVTGIYADPDDPATRIDLVDTPSTLRLASEAAVGFMRRKLMAAEEALDGGAIAVDIGDGTIDAPIDAALAGDATRITTDAIAEGCEA